MPDSLFYKIYRRMAEEAPEGASIFWVSPLLLRRSVRSSPIFLRLVFIPQIYKSFLYGKLLDTH